MSERGSFVTEYIYCKKCFETAKMILTDHALNPTDISGKILAGRIGGLHSGEEIEVFECSVIPDLEKSICHNIRIAILGETGEMIITAVPSITTIESEAHRIETRRFMGSLEKEITKKYLERKIAQEKTV